MASLDVDALREETDLFGLYIAISIIYALLGTFENSVVIYLFTRKNSSFAGNAYVVALALFDILACTVLAQVMLFAHKLQSMQYVFTVCWSFAEWLVLCYLCVLAAMSLDRLMAVVRPLRYQRVRNLQKYIVTGITITVACLTNLQALFRLLRDKATVDKINDAIFLLAIAGCLIVIIVSYTIIIRKLLQHNMKVQSELSKHHTKKDIATKGPVHATTVKVFIGVSILFVASYIPLVVAHITDHLLFYKFFYTINHIGNPIICYTLNKKFREDANALGRKWILICSRKHQTAEE